MKTHVMITQHILVMITLHLNLTFTIHVVIAQCACVSKLIHGDFSTFIEINMKALSANVVITKHIQVDQKYCPDVSKQMSQHIHGDCISSAITHTAPLCNPSHQTDGYVHMTPEWGGKKESHEFSYISPRVTGKDSEYCWEKCNTFGEKCHWSPYSDQRPGKHDNLHEVFPAHFGDGNNPHSLQW